MAEHGLEGPVIGLSLDGTGYGTDGKIWGGEVLISRPDQFARFAHLEYVPVPGGEAAIREPWRMAVGHLHTAGIDLNDPAIAESLGATPKELALMQRMIERGLNSPLTSSCGRLFDAVAALVLKRRTVDYEAQAAIELEGIAIDEGDKGGCQDYVPELWSTKQSNDGSRILKTNRLWHALVDDLRRGEREERIAARFHSGLAEGFIWAVANARKTTGIAKVALSGGCFHNRRLTRLLREGLREEGFEVFQHRQVSPGDGGLSYGQAVVAAAILRNRREQGPPGP